ncbi:hypothetical protein ACB092_12G136300 [Castanea dentata]
MAFRGIILQQQLLLGLLILTATTTSQPHSSCINRSGSVSIPYRFGTRDGCYLDESFLITCNHTFEPPKPFLPHSNIIVRLSATYHWMGLVTRVVRKRSRLNLSKFPISYTKNKFTALGCDTYVIIKGRAQGQNYTTGCISLCDSIESVNNGSCSGIGCCQTSIPEGVANFSVSLGSFNNHSAVHDFNPCSFGFVVEEKECKFSPSDLKNLENMESVPVVLDWAVGNETCEVAKRNSTSYACKAGNSTCYASNNGPGYRCNCSSGFRGNPYLWMHSMLHFYLHVNRCKDSNPYAKKCNYFPGGFNCYCPKEYEGDGLKNGTGCRPTASQSKIVIIALCISVGLLVLLLIKLKEKFFQQNGGLLLQEKLSNHQGSAETTRIYSAEELEKATNNYDESRVLGQGSYGTVYRGILPNKKVVAIKKSKIGSQSQVEQFINEITVLTQIIHKNVVKLLGCCLETEVPLLVYEFITNGTLSDHIHDKGQSFLLSWEKCLKIATETVGALAYLHSATSVPIIHRNVKTANILLDNNFTAKVSDFGASRLIPLDQTELRTLVQGAFGYLDPEYFHTSELTEKKLLTGRMALSFKSAESDRNLAMYFVSAVKGDRLLQILKDHIVNEGIGNGTRGVGYHGKTSLGKTNVYTKETKCLLSAPTQSFSIDVGTNCSTSITAGYDSMRKQVLKPLDDGR